jgi:hypothetical protein
METSVLMQISFSLFRVLLPVWLFGTTQDEHDGSGRKSRDQALKKEEAPTGGAGFFQIPCME